MKFLYKKVNDCVQHIILQKFTNFHAIRSCSFQNVCNEIGWPRFLRHPVHVYYIMASLESFVLNCVFSVRSFKQATTKQLSMPIRMPFGSTAKCRRILVLFAG